MKKKGISLILLVITIIIIIIIATAVILNLNSNNPVDKARMANVQQTRDSLKSGINLYIAKIMVEENGNHKAQTMILGKNDEVKKYQIIAGDFQSGTTNSAIIQGSKQVWQLDYTKVNSLVNIKLDIYDGSSRWYIDEYGNPYLVYDKLSNVASYLKDETGNVSMSVSDFVVYLDQDIEFSENTEPVTQEPEEDLTSSITVTKNSNSTATISGFSRNGIKSITYTGPRQGTLTPTINGNYYTAVANVGNGDYTFTVTDNNDEVIEKAETISGITSFTVASVEDLCKFRDYVNGGDDFEGITVTQTTDLDLSTVCSATLGSFMPIGSWDHVQNKGICFLGSYNGNNHKILNLYIHSNIDYNVALFVISSENTIIQNLLIENANLLNQCDNTDDISLCSGIVARNYGTIENCALIESRIEISRTTDRNCNVGGIVGMNFPSGIVKNCYNTSEIVGSGFMSNSGSGCRAGGIIGINQGKVNDCYNTGKISCSGYWAFVGGISGLMQIATSKITNCYNIGEISIPSGTRTYLGGVAGSNGSSTTNPAGTITNCYCTSSTEYLNWEYINSYTSKPAVIMSKNPGVLDTNIWKEDENNINDGYPILTWQ